MFQKFLRYTGIPSWSNTQLNNNFHSNSLKNLIHSKNNLSNAGIDQIST